MLEPSAYCYAPYEKLKQTPCLNETVIVVHVIIRSSNDNVSLSYEHDYHPSKFLYFSKNLACLSTGFTLGIYSLHETPWNFSKIVHS